MHSDVDRDLIRLQAFGDARRRIFYACVLSALLGLAPGVAIISAFAGKSYWTASSPGAYSTHVFVDQRSGREVGPAQLTHSRTNIASVMLWVVSGVAIVLGALEVAAYRAARRKMAMLSVRVTTRIRERLMPPIVSALQVGAAAAFGGAMLGALLMPLREVAVVLALVAWLPAGFFIGKSVSENIFAGVNVDD